MFEEIYHDGRRREVIYEGEAYGTYKSHRFRHRIHSLFGIRPTIEEEREIRYDFTDLDVDIRYLYFENGKCTVIMSTGPKKQSQDIASALAAKVIGRRAKQAKE